MIEIIPSILATTKEDFDQMLGKVGSYTSLVHIDISDGVFVNSKTIGIEEIRANSPHFNLSVHLMVQHPEMVLPGWLELSNLESIIFHIEATDKTQEIIDTIHRAGKQVGIAINPETDVESLGSFATKVDQVQFMTVHPGNYGGEFVSDVLEKIKNFHAEHPEVVIAVDGAIHSETARATVAVGATRLILGSHIFSESRDIGEAISELKNYIHT